MKNNYHFTLADGSCWIFQAEDEIAEWLDDLARIIGVKTGGTTADHSIFFYSADVGKSAITRSGFPEEDGTWEYYFNGRPIHLWINRSTNINIIEIDKKFFHVRDMYYLNMSSSLAPLWLHALKNGGVPVHAALAAYQQKGILIAATGDTGKTTCCKRLPKDKWQPYCDDLCLLIRNRQGELCAHPLPTWSDYMVRDMNTEWKIETSVPLKVIFFLEQSPVDEVIPLSPIETSVRLLDSVKQGWFWDIDDNKQQLRTNNIGIFNNTQQIAREIPGYILRASLTGEFWKYIEEEL